MSNLGVQTPSTMEDLGGLCELDLCVVLVAVRCGLA